MLETINTREDIMALDANKLNDLSQKSASF